MLPISYMEMHNAGLRALLGCTFLLASAAQAATYYVREGGSDTAGGLTHDTAWASIDKIKNHSFEPGDRVLFHEGDRFAGHLLVHWSGTPGSKVIIGAYYVEDGLPRRGFRTARPVIDGEDQRPNNRFDGLVRVRGDRVRVENLSVVNSEGRGIQFEGADFGEVAHCRIYNSYKSGIKFLNSPNALALGNRVELAGVASPEDGGVWGGAIELVASDYGRIAENEVLRVYGEGINANHGSRYALIEDNVVFAAKAVGIYLDAAPDATIRRNLVHGTTDPEFWRAHDAVGAGIALNNEAYHYDTDRGGLPVDPLPVGVQTQRAAIYSNLVAYTSSGLSFWGQLDETTYDDVMVFNNTFVDNNTQLTLTGKPKPGAMFMNNLLASLSPGTRDTDGSPLNGMTARNNYLSRGDPDGDFPHESNVHEELTLAKSSGWRSISEPNELSWRDFLVVPGSVAIGSGTDDPLLLSQGGNSFELDFNGLPHNSPMDIGALRYSETLANKPKKPTDVAGTPH